MNGWRPPTSTRPNAIRVVPTLDAGRGRDVLAAARARHVDDEVARRVVRDRVLVQRRRRLSPAVGVDALDRLADPERRRDLVERPRERHAAAEVILLVEHAPDERDPEVRDHVAHVVGGRERELAVGLGHLGRDVGTGPRRGAVGAPHALQRAVPELELEDAVRDRRSTGRGSRRARRAARRCRSSSAAAACSRRAGSRSRATRVRRRSRRTRSSRGRRARPRRR